MQEDVEQKSVSIIIKGVKLTGRLFKAALRKFLSVQKDRKVTKSRTIPHGKQSVKQIVGQNQGVSNIEITDKNIKSFESIARKYGVDFALKKDRSGPVPKYLVFFKARDADALTAAFKEYTAKRVRSKKPSVLEQLRKTQAIGKDKTLDRVKNKTKEWSR